MFNLVKVVIGSSIPTKIFKSVVFRITIVMAAFHSFRTRADKCFKNKSRDSLNILPFIVAKVNLKSLSVNVFPCFYFFPLDISCCAHTNFSNKFSTYFISFCYLSHREFCSLKFLFDITDNRIWDAIFSCRSSFRPYITIGSCFVIWESWYCFVLHFSRHRLISFL